MYEVLYLYIFDYVEYPLVNKVLRIIIVNYSNTHYIVHAYYRVLSYSYFRSTLRYTKTSYILIYPYTYINTLQGSSRFILVCVSTRTYV